MYTPDRWIVVKLTTEEYGTYYKVLAGWSGSYVSSDSWKLNSGITGIDDMEDHYIFHGASGSKYKCYKTREGYNMITGSIFHQLQEAYGDDVVSESSVEEAKGGLLSNG